MLLLLFIPLVIDFPRSFGKSTFLLCHALYRKLRPYPVRECYSPKVSVVIPAHNEAPKIERTINAALENSWPIKEVVVVDDGSTDDTYPIALRYAVKGQIKLIRRPSSGLKSTAVNTGIAVSDGEIVAVVDAYTLLERSALVELVNDFSDPRVDAVSGNVRVLAGVRGRRGLLVRMQSYEYMISMETGRRFNALVGTLLIIPGALGAFRRGVGASFGYFDRDTMTEDFDMTLKLRKLGRILRFATRAVAWTYVPDTWRSWIRQRTRWHIGQFETLWKHRNIYLKQRFSMPLVSAVYDMLLMDAVLIVARLASFLILLWIYVSNLWILMYLYLLTFLVYFVSELVVITTSTILSPRKHDLKCVFLMPLVVLFYRPVYGLVRLRAYLSCLLGHRTRW
jgi:cellulose synthase/poly-beta-1,6-N-acetylglucosamine synthase-like glycosyltransferase